MNSINVNIPIANLPQVSQHQSEVNRAPIVHQMQTAESARDSVDIKLRSAQEAQEAEGKIVNPKDRKNEKQNSRGRDKGQENDDDESEDTFGGAAIKMTDSGRFIDLEA